MSYQKYIAIIAVLVAAVGVASASIHVGPLNVWTVGIDLENSMSDLGVRAVETYPTSSLEVYTRTGIPLSEVAVSNTVDLKFDKVGQMESGFTLYHASDNYTDAYAAINEYLGATVVITGDTLEDVIFTMDRTRIDKSLEPYGKEAIYIGSAYNATCEAVYSL